MSKSQMSKQIQRLEAVTHATLFHRTTRRVSLTEIGKELFNYSRKIIDISRQAATQVQDLSQGKSGILRFTAPNLFGQYVFDSFVS